MSARRCLSPVRSARRCYFWSARHREHLGLTTSPIAGLTAVIPTRVYTRTTYPQHAREEAARRMSSLAHRLSAQMRTVCTATLTCALHPLVELALLLGSRQRRTGPCPTACHLRPGGATIMPRSTHYWQRQRPWTAQGILYWELKVD